MNLPHVDSFQDLMDCLLGRKEEFGSAEFRQYSKIAIQAKNVLNGVVAPDEEDILAMYEHAFAKKE
jgi:hypothetical protein